MVSTIEKGDLVMSKKTFMENFKSLTLKEIESVKNQLKKEIKENTQEIQDTDKENDLVDLYNEKIQFDIFFKEKEIEFIEHLENLIKNDKLKKISFFEFGIVRIAYHPSKVYNLYLSYRCTYRNLKIYYKN